MEGKIEVKANKKGMKILRGWLIALGVVALLFLTGFICCTFIW